MAGPETYLRTSFEIIETIFYGKNERVSISLLFKCRWKVSLGTLHLDSPKAIKPVVQ